MFLQMNFELKPFNFDFNFGGKDKKPFEFPTARYFVPEQLPEVSEEYLKYSDAEKLIDKIDLHRNCRYFVILNGSFIFGDLIEAIITKYDFHVKKLTISTLSLNQNNVDSLENLLTGGYVENLDLIISWFFFAHERHKDGLIPYIYEKLDNIENTNFQLSACRSHCKIAQFETFDGVYLNIHGSANLRTSDNLEQIVIEDNKSLYQWNDEWLSAISKKYRTINKNISGGSKELWKTLKGE